MTLGDWCDAAWSALLDDIPMMANPVEYRTMMYEAFWEGKSPRPKAPTHSRSKGGASTPPPMPQASGPPRHAVAALEREMEMIRAIQAEKAQAE